MLFVFRIGMQNVWMNIIFSIFDKFLCAWKYYLMNGFIEKYIIWIKIIFVHRNME